MVEAASDLRDFEQDIVNQFSLTCSVAAVAGGTTSTPNLLLPSATAGATSTIIKSPAAAASSTQPRNTQLPTSSDDDLPYPARIGVTVGVLLGGLMIIVLAILLWRSERRRKRLIRPVEGQTRKRRSWAWSWFPYLQQKGELDAEGQRRNELNATVKHRELQEEGLLELLVKEQRQELRSGECATEMGVSDSPLSHR